MAKKQFKTESKKLLDMMINSIYTHKEIFLRELISNASDAIDKRYFRSLTDPKAALSGGEYEIRIAADKTSRILMIFDNGCGMTKEELDSNLGTIAKSGSFDFKSENGDGQDGADKIDIIGQFGVGFYSAFMVSSEITVETRAIDSDEAYRWRSSGADGYTVDTCAKADVGTTITLRLKENTEDENYDEFLDEWRIKELVKKYSDYIRYPIRMSVTKSRKKAGSPDDKPEYESYVEDETLNSMVPLWKRPKGEVSDEEYATFYREKFFDYEPPLKVIRQKTEGVSNYEALLFIPSHAPYDYYSTEYEKGLKLYSSGVLIMDKCKDLLPDHFGFVAGLVDSADLSLNISREMLQHDRQLKSIAKAIEKKIGSELSKMLENERENYEKFYKAFGRQLMFGVYSDFGAHKDSLKDLILFVSSNEKKNVTLKEYVSRMKEDQKKIYYAAGDSVEQISLLPQVEAVTSHGYEVLYLTEDIDEFALQILREYDEKEFSNVCQDDLDLSTDEEKESLKAENEKNADMFAFIKESIGGDVHAVRFTNTLKNHPACISSEGPVSVGMEKTLSRMPGFEEGGIKAELVLEISMTHPIADKLKALFETDKDRLSKYSKILYAQARLISGMELKNAAEIGSLVCELMVE
ncbi:MAG: molecular chaperone HtpG [Clostridia bacterium]|nr:molecular chaperone HtpG [Clostridia bacterium]